MFFNEAELQHRLACHLRMSAHCDEVWLEYYVPGGVVGEYDNLWHSSMRVDIVVRRGEEYVPIELKYKTSSLLFKTFTRFGSPLPDRKEKEENGEEVLRDMVAYNIGHYDVWKDIKRLELLKAHFPQVSGGLFVMLTNSAAYMKEPLQNSNYKNFSLAEGVHDIHKCWQTDGQAVCHEQRPDFDVSRPYAVHWHPLPQLKQKADKNNDFHYTTIVV